MFLNQPIRLIFKAYLRGPYKKKQLSCFDDPITVS